MSDDNNDVPLAFSTIPNERDREWPVSLGKSEAVKADADKPMPELIPPEALNEVAKVLSFGARKYSAHNWRNGKGLAYSRLVGAALRHLYAWSAGEDNDKETGYSHLAHCACCVLFLLTYVTVGGGIDDRFKK